MSAHVAVQSVYLLLSKYNIGVAAQFMLDFKLESDCTLERAIILLNRHWRDVLAQRPYDTLQVRTYLVDDCSLPEWLRLFERGVLPTLVAAEVRRVG